MDRLAIRTTPRTDPKYGMRWIDVEVRVNDRPLTAIVDAFERGRGYSPAGRYAYISVDGLQPAADRLMGSPETWADEGETAMLICRECREEGCWPLFARIEVGDTEVRWSAFRQPYQSEWDYSALQFTFERQQYVAEVAHALGSRPSA